MLRKNILAWIFRTGLIGLPLALSCTEKELDPNNPQASYGIAKEPYDDKNYEIASKKLGEFKARFPYSRYAVEAELLLADCQFELGHYVESAASYKEFVKLHPKHAQVDFALFRVGMSYWQDAPADLDREQEYTELALKEWQTLIEQHPQSSYTQQAIDLKQKGLKRIQGSEEFVANFYCKQGLWHACAYKFNSIAEKYPSDKVLLKRSLEKTADALEKLATQSKEQAQNEKDGPKKSANLWIRDLSPEEILKKAEELRSKASSL